MQQSSGSIASLAAALAKAQVELVNPEKSMVASIRLEGRGAPEQMFRYAPLSSGLDIVRKVLGRHEIATLQSTAIDSTAGIVTLKTVLVHSSGEWISSDWPVCAMDETASPKRMGAALTYARRYALFALVGIAGEDDLDAPDLNSPEPTEIAKDQAPLGGRPRLNGARKHSRRPELARQKNAKPEVVYGNSRLKGQLSAVLRDQLLSELKKVRSSDEAAIWARRILPAKNSLETEDAQLVQDAFAAMLARMQDAELSSNPRTTVASSVQPDVKTPENGKETGSSIVHMRRLRDKDHLRFVAKQPCLVCGRTPADSHHIRLAQLPALGRKVSDEFCVPLCRGHHRELHRHGDESAWWTKLGIDPKPKARALWLQSHPLAPPT
jgi:hypothetical protein